MPYWVPSLSLPSSLPTADDPVEELEPLFDYTRVQPAEFFYFDDQGLETSPIFTHCKRTNLSNDRGKENVRCEDVVVLKEDEGAKKGNEEEDWLPPPPPKAPGSGLDLEKNETFRKLSMLGNSYNVLPFQLLRTEEALRNPP